MRATRWVTAAVMLAVTAGCVPPAPTGPSESTTTHAIAVFLGDDAFVEVEYIALRRVYHESPTRFSLDLSISQVGNDGTVLPLDDQVVLVDDLEVVTEDGGPDGMPVRAAMWTDNHTVAVTADIIACVQVIDHHAGDAIVTPDVCSTLPPAVL